MIPYPCLIECEDCNGVTEIGFPCAACDAGLVDSSCICRERHADENGVRRLMRDVGVKRYGSLHMCPDCQESCDCAGPADEQGLDEEIRECVHDCDPWARIATDYERMT